MPTYSYKASKPNGEIMSGELSGDTREAIIQKLHEQGLIIINIDEKIGLHFGRLSNVQIGDISLTDKVIFTRQLATMLGAGLPVTAALDILIEQQKSPKLKTSLTMIYKDVQSGLGLAASFRKYKAIFSELQLSLIEAGEKSGNLVEIIKQIAVDMQKSASIQGKIKGALIYPAIIFFAIIIVVIVLVVFMVPAVKDLYKDLGGGDLPAITQVLVIISEFFTNPIGLLLSGIFVVGTIIGYRSYSKTDSGRRVIDRVTLRIPVFGDLTAKIQVVQMTRLLQLLIHSGIPIIDALRATANSLGNVHFKNALLYAAQEVAKGTPLAPPLAKSKVIPLIVVRMISTGEQTGALDKILGDLTLFYEEQVEEITSNLTKLMEPLILLIVGGLVGLLAIAVYLPIYQVANFV
jgi:type IV pilus assembly protein PilC